MFRTLTSGLGSALVFGSYGEWSKDVNSLMDLCIKRIAENNWVTDGYHSKSDMKSVLASSLKSHLRRTNIAHVGGPTDTQPHEGHWMRY